MKNKIIQSVPAMLALIAVGFSYFSLWCTNDGHFCYRTWLDSIFLYSVNPLYFFALFFLPIAFILIFIPRTVFNSWLKLAVWMIPLAIIYIFITPVSSGGGWVDFFPFYRDDAARLSATIFSGISLILIIWKFLVARRHASV